MSRGLLTVTVLVLQVIAACSAPAPLLLHPKQKSQQSQQLLRQQLLQLQQFDGLQTKPVPAQLTTPPIIIFLQNIAAADTTADTTAARRHGQTPGEAAKTNANKGIVDEDSDSVILEAVSEEDEIKSQSVLLFPTGLKHARLSIGGLISAIPFLPIEINVPDTIGWAYNGISSIISIFGRLPIAASVPGSGTQDASPQAEVRSVLHQLQAKTRGLAALLVVPVVPQAYTIRVPILV